LAENLRANPGRQCNPNRAGPGRQKGCASASRPNSPRRPASARSEPSPGAASDSSSSQVGSSTFPDNRGRHGRHVPPHVPATWLPPRLSGRTDEDLHGPDHPTGTTRHHKDYGAAAPPAYHPVLRSDGSGASYFFTLWNGLGVPQQWNACGTNVTHGRVTCTCGPTDFLPACEPARLATGRVETTSSPRYVTRQLREGANRL